MDVRQKEAPFKFRGREYRLRCNFNVLAEVTERNGGELPDIFDKASRLRVVRDYLAAMLNDYADEQGWAERVTPAQLGRELDGGLAAVLSPVIELVLGALYVPAEEGGEEEHPKN